MIPADLYLAFIAATAVLMIVPGPNVALIVANSVAHGTRYGLLTVAATSTAVVIHLILTVLGASAVLDVLAADVPAHIDQLLLSCGLPPAGLMTALLSLEMKDKIRQLPGKSFLRKL